MLYSFDWFKILNISIPCTFSNKGAEKNYSHMIEVILENNLIYTEKMIGVTETLTTSISFLGQYY